MNLTNHEVKPYEEVILDFSDLNSLKRIMKMYGSLEYALLGNNKDDELTITSIFPDRIVHETHQNNGWTRKNIFHEDGTVEELYERGDK